jgi:hypothetical protein
MMSWRWEHMSLHTDSNLSGLLLMLKLLKDSLDNMEPLHRSSHVDLVLGPESPTRGFRLPQR